MSDLGRFADATHADSVVMSGSKNDFYDLDLQRNFPRDRFRSNPYETVDSISRERHPVQVLEERDRTRYREERVRWLAQVYGTHLPLRLLFEEHIMREVYRPVTVRSSCLGWEVLSGAIETLQPGEFHARAGRLESLDERVLDVHLAMEKRMGLEHD